MYSVADLHVIPGAHSVNFASSTAPSTGPLRPIINSPVPPSRSANSYTSRSVTTTSSMSLLQLPLCLKDLNTSSVNIASSLSFSNSQPMLASTATVSSRSEIAVAAKASITTSLWSNYLFPKLQRTSV